LSQKSPYWRDRLIACAVGVAAGLGSILMALAPIGLHASPALLLLGGLLMWAATTAAAWPTSKKRAGTRAQAGVRPGAEARLTPHERPTDPGKVARPPGRTTKKIGPIITVIGSPRLSAAAG
jgi:hypothetical protein